MQIEETDYHPNGDSRYKVVVEEKTYFLHITKEAVEDDLKEGLTNDKKANLEEIVRSRIATKDFDQDFDKVGVPYEIILIKTGDLAYTE